MYWLKTTWKQLLYPYVKTKWGSLTLVSTDHARATVITLTFQHDVLSHISTLTTTGVNQFGFKGQHCADARVHTLKQIVSHLLSVTGMFFRRS